MYIQPNSTLRLLSGVPLDITYINTLWWNTKEQQMSYFESKSVRTFNNLTYQRYNEGTIRIEGSADSYYNVNYLMFQNTSYGDKWFYGFVNNVEYINDNMSMVYYTLDLMQTWFFDYTIFNCMVEREHSITDNIGENLQFEGLETGDYIIEAVEYVIAPFYKYDGEHTSYSTGARWVLFATEPPPQMTGEFEPIKNGVYSGLYRYDGLSLSTLTEFVQAYNQYGKQDAIVSIAQYPSFFDTDSPQSRYYNSTEQNFTSIDGYIPKNKKLFTHPYHNVSLVSSDGSANTLKYEYFNALTPRFYIEGITNPMPEAFCFPVNYNGDASNLLEGVFVKNFPTVPVISDTFSAWWAQNKNSINATLNNTARSRDLTISQAQTNALFNVGDTALRGIGNAISIGATGGISSVGSSLLQLPGNGGFDLFGIGKQVSNAYNTGVDIAREAIGFKQIEASANLQYENANRTALGAKADHSVIPNGVIGHASSAGSIYSLNACGFRLYHQSIRAQFARIIDDYFDRYGYATNRVKQPNRNSRPHWNYVRTIGCAINGNIPVDHAEGIQAIYDNGITFWKNPSEVNNYTLDNRPV